MKKLAFVLPALLVLAACGDDSPQPPAGGSSGCTSSHGESQQHEANEVNDGTENCR